MQLKTYYIHATQNPMSSPLRYIMTFSVDIWISHFCFPFSFFTRVPAFFFFFLFSSFFLLSSFFSSKSVDIFARFLSCRAVINGHNASVTCSPTDVCFHRVRSSISRSFRLINIHGTGPCIHDMWRYCEFARWLRVAGFHFFQPSLII